VPWRFSDAGHLSARSASSCRRPKNLVWGIRCQEAIFRSVHFVWILSGISSFSNSIVRPRRSHSPVPAARSERRRRAAAVKGWPSGHREAARSVLDGREHDGKMRRLGTTHFALVRESVLTSTCDTAVAVDGIRGELAIGVCADRASRPCIRSILWGSHHDAVIRIGGELRGGGSTLHSGSRAMVFVGSPPPRMSSADPARDRQTVVLLSDPFSSQSSVYDAGRRTMPSDSSPVVARCQSAMSSLRANATIIVLRVPPRPSAVRV
jgi:hypothetical protein